MRLLAFAEKGRRSIGAELDSERLVDFHRAHGAMPTGMRAFLELGDEGLEDSQGNHEGTASRSGDIEMRHSSFFSSVLSGTPEDFLYWGKLCRPRSRNRVQAS